MRKTIKRVAVTALAVAAAAGLTGCSSATSGRRIIRVSHAQSGTHPEHIGLLTFKEHVEERLGGRYKVQMFPNETLDFTQKAIELTQAGIIDFIAARTANLEAFAGIYRIFSMPHLFGSEDVYKPVMQDTDYMGKVYRSMDEAGFRMVIWYSTGVRNSYTKTPIHTPDDLKGKKIRVQQSLASVTMVNAFGTATTPMGFDEVYTVIQQGVTDGVENNGLALTDNKHDEVTKYYAYSKYQMMSDMLVANLRFSNGLSPEGYQIFEDAAVLSAEVELREWDESIETAKDIAQNRMGAESIDTNVDALKQKVLPLHETMLNDNPRIVDLCNRVREINEKAKGGK